MSDKPTIKPARDVIVELQFENETLRAELNRLRTPIPSCGHPPDCVRTADDFADHDGTGYCGWCAALEEAKWLQEQLDRKQAVLDAIRRQFWQDVEEAKA